MTQEASYEEIEKAKLNQETSQMNWLELQRYFAAGSLLWVDASLDLIDVGFQMSQDNKAMFSQWLEQKLVTPVSDDQAAQWFDEKADVWTVVVKPWILVQRSSESLN
ncbi:hypothetical protein ACH42_16595 [Endozoicomonas sp. (ex Bugula neritina AB1)]|nr:hypothetical protein ACH42_16595 [Endozoicomonas sp. (ex Bugula neritina AB1)]